MGQIIVKAAVVRKPGFLYYIDGQGNLCCAKMKVGGKKKAKKATKKIVKAVKASSKAKAKSKKK